MTKRTAKAAKPGPSPAETKLRDPTASERASIAKASAKLEKLRGERVAAPRLGRMDVGHDGTARVAQPHSDHVGWCEQMRATLGTTSDVFADRLSAQLGSASAPSAAAYGLATEQGLAFMAGVDPQNEVQATLGAQMYATHVGVMEMGRRMMAASTLEQMTAYGSLMTKLARTSTAQVEAMAKLRSGGKQQVEVRYVYVDARGSQNVIAAGPGGGARSGNDGQPHAPAQLAHDPASEVPPLWGTNPLGVALHVAGHPAPEAMQDARRPEPGSAHGTGERGLDRRTLHGGADGEQARAAGAGAAVQGDAE